MSEFLPSLASFIHEEMRNVNLFYHFKFEKNESTTWSFPFRDHALFIRTYYCKLLSAKNNSTLCFDHIAQLSTLLADCITFYTFSRLHNFLLFYQIVQLSTFAVKFQPCVIFWSDIGNLHILGKMCLIKC